MKTGDSRFGIDANVILRYLLTDSQDLSPKAISIFEALQDGQIEVYCDPVTLSEVVWVLTSFYGLGREQIGSRVGDLIKAEGFRVPDKAVYVQALELYSGPVPNYGDACACAAALQECGGRLLSFDQALSRVEGITRAETPPLGEGAE